MVWLKKVHFPRLLVNSPSDFVPELRELLRSIVDTIDGGGVLELEHKMEGSARRFIKQDALYTSESNVAPCKTDLMLSPECGSLS
jgi:hypothetical protein